MAKNDKLVDQFLYLGVDPGSSKTGLALVDVQGDIHKLYIAKSDNFIKELTDFCAEENVVAVILGDGTHSEEVAKLVKDALPNLPQSFVHEAYSTEDARKLYWEVNPPRGWRSFIPLGLLVPPEPLDAYAAVIQVRRWLIQKFDTKN